MSLLSAAWDFLASPFVEFAFMRRALAGCLALALGATPIGVFLLLRRMSLMGDAMSHAILPGAVFTEIERKTVTPAQKERIIAMQCIPRAETPDDLVGTVLFLASEASAFVTGQVINVDGGATHP